MKESTRNIIKMHGRRYDRAAHNYIYFTMYDVYVKYFLRAGRAVLKYLHRLPVSSWAFGQVFERYHGKVVTQENAEKILTLQEDVILGPDKTERIIPYRYANNIILKEPQFIAMMDCPCRLSRENPCQPVNVCMAVGRTTAQFWMEHGKKYNVRRVSQDEALKIMREAHEQGCITTAWFKVATGGRTGVICQCCTCCCGALEGDRIVKRLAGGEKYSNIAPSGYRVRIDEERCRGCGDCARACSVFKAVTIEEGSRPVYHEGLCKGCGVCVEKCPAGARELYWDREAGGPVPLDLDIVGEMLSRRG